MACSASDMDDAKIKNRAAAVDAQAEEATAAPEPIEVPAVDVEAPPSVAEAPAISPEDEARGLIDVIVASVVPFFPSLESVYDEEARARLAAVTAPLMRKYNLSASSIFDRWKEEIAFAFVALPLAMKTAEAVKAERAKKAPPASAAPEASPVSDSDVVPPLVMN